MIYIKKENARKWLIENLVHDIDTRDDYSHYILLKDEIVITKEVKDLLEKEHLIIEVEDYSRFSRQSLINKYIYITEEHDSLSLKCTLKHFKVIVVDKDK